MYTYTLISSNQKCFRAAWYPSEDPEVGHREKRWPLMMFESGQCNRVRESNLKLITK